MLVSPSAGESHLQAFPTSAGEAGSETVLEIPYWRAGLLDYFGEIWDAIGTPALEFEECMAMQEFPMLIDDGRPACLFCFAAFDSGAAERAHRCVVLQYVPKSWPTSPWDKSQ